MDNGKSAENLGKNFLSNRQCLLHSRDFSISMFVELDS